MQIGLITIDGQPVGLVSFVYGLTPDDFTPNTDGYVPEGRASGSHLGGDGFGGDGHSHSGHRPGHHDGGSAVSGEQHHHYPGHHPSAAPSGQTYSASGGRPVSRGSAATEGAIEEASKANRLDPNFMKSAASIESGMNPGSNANRSTQYKGLYQIGRNEWDRFGQGNIYDAHDNAMAAGRMFSENRKQFHNKFGRDPTDTEMYLMHQQGLGFYTNGAMTNIGGNPYPGMHGPQTHDSFEAGWGREVARRKDAFEHGGRSPEAAAPATAAGSGQSTDALDWMKQREGLSENTNRAQLRSDMGGFDPGSEPWCAAFVNSALKNSGIKGSGSAVANSFQRWGSRVGPDDVKAGDVSLLTRGRGPDQAGGHVGMATGNTRVGPGGQRQFEMEAGNDADMVRRTWHNTDDPSVQFRRANQPKPAQTASADKPFDPETMAP